MGKIPNGLLGGISGSVGPVVGVNYKGMNYLRAKPTKRKTRRSTHAQMVQQARFAVAMKFVNSLYDLVVTSFGSHARLMTGLNNALSDLLKRAITGVYPHYDILYSEVMVSRGSLPNARLVKAVAGPPGTIRFDWINMDIAIGKAKPKDQVLLVAYCPELNRALYHKGTSREAMTDTINVAGLSGKTLQTWMTFISEDGRDIADSRFAGEVVVS